MDPNLRAAQTELTKKVMGKPGITGTAIGQVGGKPCLKVYVSDEKAGLEVPRSVGGFRVIVEKTGVFKRL